MKTVSVRISEGQAKNLREGADLMGTTSINGLVQRAVDLWLAIEGEVYRETLQEARTRIRSGDRRPVAG